MTPVERAVALAICQTMLCDRWEDLAPEQQECLARAAGAAMAAHLSALAEAGLVVVPREPGEDMLSRLVYENKWPNPADGGYIDPADAYRILIAEATK